MENEKEIYIKSSIYVSLLAFVFILFSIQMKNYFILIGGILVVYFFIKLLENFYFPKKIQKEFFKLQYIQLNLFLLVLAFLWFFIGATIFILKNNLL